MSKEETSEKKTEPDKKASTSEESSTSVEKTDESSKIEPKPKEYTPDEIESIANMVETPRDQTPPYNPKFILSKEFKGTSNYEHGIEIVKQDLQKTIDSAQDPESLSRAKEEMRKLDYLYQNFNIGMNVFRTAKGGRDKLRV